MSSELDFELHKTECLTNLKILAKLQVGDKLIYTNKSFSIDKWFYLQPLYRWYYNESRATTIKHLNEFIQQVFSLIDIIYANEMGHLENNYYTNVKPIVFKEENASILISIINELQNAADGLNNLKQTYKDDVNIATSLNIIIEKIHVRIKKIHNILHIQNK